MQRTLTILTLVAAAALALPAEPASAVDFGIRAGIYDDADSAFVGADLLFQLSPRWYFNPNIEYVFVDDGDLFTVNGDFHYDFPVDFDGYVWAGAGAALISDDRDLPPRRRDDEQDNDFGLNLLGGIGWNVNGMVPYVQGKLIVADDNEAVFGVGLRF
jgi:hypothetical protein